MPNLFAKKPLVMLLEEAVRSDEHSLKRVLGSVDLVTLAIGM